MAIFHRLTTDVMDNQMEITPRPDSEPSSQYRPPYRMDSSNRQNQTARNSPVEGLGIRCGSRSRCSEETSNESYGPSSRVRREKHQNGLRYGFPESSQSFQYSIDPPSATEPYPFGFTTSELPSNIDVFDFDSVIDEANGLQDRSSIFIHAPQPQHASVDFSNSFHNNTKNFSYPSIKQSVSKIPEIYDENMTGQEMDGSWNYGINDHNLQCDDAMQTTQPPLQTMFVPNSDQWHISNDGSSNLPMVYEEPAQLQPSIEFYDGHSRRVSLSSNAPSSVFSGESQDTPYFLTPSSTPMFTPSSLMENHCTPMSTYTSPSYQIHSRSPSMGSAKALTPRLRHLRPAPYALDSSQRHRNSDGKTMSLPPKRITPSSMDLSSNPPRALSECNMTSYLQADDYGAGYRESFDYNLNMIRRSDPGVAHAQSQIQYSKSAAEQSDAERPQSFPFLKAKKTSERLLPTLPPRPPLALPNREKQHLSPPPGDLNPSPEDGPPKPKRLTQCFSTDVYTPKYSRGRKDQLEGWCGECELWLNMKKSAYWYHKMSNHGVNPKTKEYFEIPVDFRWKKGSTVIREGYCPVCEHWVVMDTVKMTWRRWYKHAYVCQNKPDEEKSALEHESRGREVQQMTAHNAGPHGHSHSHSHPHSLSNSHSHYNKNNMPMVQSIATIVPTDYPELVGFPNFMLDYQSGKGQETQPQQQEPQQHLGGYIFTPGDIGMAM